MDGTAAEPYRARVRPPRQGFIFLLFGTKTVVSADGGGAVNARCPNCGQVGTLAAKRMRPWFTAFFIPLIPLGGGRRFTQCGNCGANFDR